MSVTYIPSTATLANIITQTPRTILLPPASERQGRVITIKDVTGLSQINPITISTQGTNTFDGASNLYTISNAYAAATFVSRNNAWLLTGTTAQQQLSDIQVNSISSATISSIYGTISSQFLTLSTLAATVSTISFSNLVSTPFLNASLASTVQNLGQAGYASTSLIYIPSGGVALPFPPVNIPQAYLQDFSTPLSTFSTAIGPAIQSGSVSSFSTLLGQGTGASISTFSTLIGPAIQQTIGITPPQLFSTNVGLGSLLYVSASLVYVSTGTRFAFPPINVPVGFAQDWSTPMSTFSTAIGPAIAAGGSGTNINISTLLISSVIGLGSAGYISSIAPISSFISLIAYNSNVSTYISTINTVYASSLVLNFSYSYTSSYASSYTSSYDVYQSTYTSSYTSSYTINYISTYNTLSTMSNYFSTTTYQSSITYSSTSAGATTSTVTVTPTVLYTSSYTSTLSATPSGTNYYIQYTTAQSVFLTSQTFTVPIIGTANQTIGINLYGAGGGNTGSQNQIQGGAAAAVFGNLPVTPGETLTILVGSTGGGGAGFPATYPGAAGGGRTAIQRAGTDIVTAGGGGGASGWDTAYVTGGAADGATPGTGGNGLTYTGQIASYGATPTAGGAYGGALYTGGPGNGIWTQGGLTFGNGGGGAGFYGGGGGYTNGGGAGAGGNSYIGNLQNASIFNYGGQGQNGVVYVTYAISSNLASTVTYAYTSTIAVNYTSTILGYTSTVSYGIVQYQSTLNVTSTPMIGITSSFTSTQTSTTQSSIQTLYTSTQGQNLNYFSTYTSTTQSTLIGSNLALEITSSFFFTITSNFTSSYYLNESITAPIFQTTANQMTSSIVGLGSFGYASTKLIYLPSAGNVSIPFPAIRIPTYYIQDWSTPVSSVALFTSNTSNYLVALANSLVAFSSGTSFTSTVEGLGSANYVSTSQLVSTVDGLASAGYLSTLSLTSTTSGLGSAGYISTLSLISTVDGLGSAGYASTAFVRQLSNYFKNTLQDWSTSASTIALFTSNTSNLAIQMISYSNYILSNAISTSLTKFTLSSQFISTGQGLSLQTVSTGQGLSLQMVSTGQSLSLQMVSTGQGITDNLASKSYVSTTQLTSTVTSIFSAISSLQSTSQIQFLANLDYISSSQLLSTTSGLTLTISTAAGQTNTLSSFGAVNIVQLNSTVVGLGNVGFASTSLIYVSTGTRIAFPPINIPVAFIQDWSTPLSSLSLSTSINFSTLLSTTVAQSFAISTLSNSFSTTGQTIANSQLTSTVIGLGNVGYVSASFVYVSSISGGFAFPPIRVPVAFAQDWSTPMSNLQTIFTNITDSITNNVVDLTNSNIETSNYVGQTLSTFSTSFTTFQFGPYLTSTVIGLGSAGYTSTSYVDQSISSLSTLLSPAITLGPNGASIQQLTSTTQGLGSAGYASTQLIYLSNLSSVNTLPFPNIVFNSVFSLSVVNSTITTNQVISATSIGAYFFYTTTTANLTITLPPPEQAGSGWNISIQNTGSSSQFITVLTTPNKQISPGTTTKFLTDGISFYFI